MSDTRRAHAAKDYAGAARFAEAGLSVGRSQHLESSDDFVDLLLELAWARMAQDEFDQVDVALNEVLALTRGDAQNIERVVDAHHGLAKAASKRSQFEVAEQHLLAALAIRERQQPVDPLGVTRSLRELASLYVTWLHMEQAVTTANRGIAMLRPGEIERDTRLFELYMTLAEAYRYGKNHAQAEAPFATAIELLAPYETERAELLVDASLRLAKTQQTLGKKREAITVLERALAWSKKSDQPKSTELQVVIQLLQAYSGAKEAQAARELFARYGLVQRTYWPGEGRFETGAATVQMPSAESAPARPVSDRAERAAEVVSGLKAAFVECYRVALDQNHELEGRVALTIQVGADGTVAFARAIVVGLAEPETDCILRAAGNAKFPASSAGDRIDVPLTFVRK